MNVKLSYNINNHKETIKRKRKENNIIWFNPPYSKSVKTNARRIFIKLISQNFPPNHKFVRIFNKNTMKLSCFCMLLHATYQIKKILPPKPKKPKKLCNCLVKEDCPMNELHLTSGILYQAIIKRNNSK